MYKPSPETQQMLDTLTEKNRPKKVASLMDEYLGDQKEYQKAVDDGFQGTYEEFLRMKSMRETAAQGGVIGKGGMFRGEELPNNREGFKKPKIRVGRVGTENAGLFGIRATNVSEADNIPGAVRFGKENVYFNTREEAEDFYKNRSKYFKSSKPTGATASDDPARLKRIDDYIKDFKEKYGKNPTAKKIRTDLNEQARVIDVYEAKYGPLAKGTKITKVDEDVLKILNDSKVLKKLETGKYPSITDISRITKLDTVLSETRLLDLAEKLADTKYASVAKNYLENTSLVNPDSPFGGRKGKKARLILENRFTKGMNIDQKLPTIRSNILREIYKIIPELKKKGLIAVDEIASLTSSMRGDMSPYPIFGQVTSSDFNTFKKGTRMDTRQGILERELRKLKPGDPRRIELIKDYNDEVSDFVRESNRVNPGKRVKAFKVSTEPPSETVKNKKVYNEFQNQFDNHYKKYGYSFEVPKNTESLLDIQNKLRNSSAFRKKIKSNFDKIKINKGGKIAIGVTLASVLPATFALADTNEDDMFMPVDPGVIVPQKKPKEPGLPAETIPATAAAAYKFGKPLLKAGAKIIGAPSVAGGLSLSNILDYEKPEDASVLDRLDPRNYKVQDDPDLKMAGLDLLLPEILKKGAPRGAGIMSMIGRGLANPFGRAARVFTPVGATLTTAGIAKDYYDFAKDEIKKVRAMEDEERKAYNEDLMDEGGLLD